MGTPRAPRPGDNGAMTDTRSAAPGGRLRAEIREQPDVAARLLVAGPPVLDAVAAEVRRRGIGLVVIAARGTSDHAAVYAQYVLGARNGLTVALAAPSLVTLYGASPQYGNALVIGLSQSGRSPDVVGVMAAARAQGALTLSITNDPASPLAMAAEHRMDLAAGEERSVAATKTYTAELLAVAMLSAALDDDGARARARGRAGGAGAGAGRRGRRDADRGRPGRARPRGRPGPRVRLRDGPRVEPQAQGGGAALGGPVLGGGLRPRAGRAAGSGIRGVREHRRWDRHATRCSTRSVR